MDYYSILGVDRSADQNQIKQAYRQKAKQHHPDKPDGDAELFKKINEAYETLGDPARRAQYDNPQPQYSFNSHNMDDHPFEHVFREFFRQQSRPVANKDLKIAITLTLEEVLKGKDVVATYNLSNGETTSANIKIPPGVEHGEAIRFRGLGDSYYSNQSRGDLIVYVRVLSHNEFVREGKNIRKSIDVSVFDLILGKKITVKSLNGSNITVNIPAGTNPGTTLSVAGYGLPDLRTSRTGNLYLTIKSITPKITNPEVLERIKKINDEISSST
jgi:DnaJ-class molecular chaperone